MFRAIDTLINSIKEDIRRTEGSFMRELLGPVVQAERVAEYCRSLAKARFHRDREGQV